MDVSCPSSDIYTTEERKNVPEPWFQQPRIAAAIKVKEVKVL